jgi:hypothetical protein
MMRAKSNGNSKFVSARRRSAITRKPASAPPATAAYSLHILVRTFAVFGDEAVDPRCDNGQRYRAELEHSIGMVTTALPFIFSSVATFESSSFLLFRKEQSYELEKNHSPWLRSSMRFGSLDCDGADERAR